MYKIEFTEIKKSLFLIEYQLKNLNHIEYFKEKIKNNIIDISHRTNVKAKMTGPVFTNDENLKSCILEATEHFNFFNLKNHYLYEAWGNTIEDDNEHVINHCHSESSLSAILYLTENGPGTIFNDFKKTIYEKVGKIVFFSSEAWHEVKPFKSKEARYTLALNFKSF